MQGCGRADRHHGAAGSACPEEECAGSPAGSRRGRQRQGSPPLAAAATPGPGQAFHVRNFADDSVSTLGLLEAKSNHDNISPTATQDCKAESKAKQLSALQCIRDHQSCAPLLGTQGFFQTRFARMQLSVIQSALAASAKWVRFVSALAARRELGVLMETRTRALGVCP